MAMTNAKYVGRFRTATAFPLVVGGKWFSPYLIDEPGMGHRVFGEVFEINEKELQFLDRIEGTHLPNGYRRISIAVENVETVHTLDVWTYVKDRESIDRIHSGPMDEYRLDPRYVLPAKQPNVF
jgi:gamma-glutamylaminecyclotransferase